MAYTDRCRLDTWLTAQNLGKASVWVRHFLLSTPQKHVGYQVNLQLFVVFNSLTACQME